MKEDRLCLPGYLARNPFHRFLWIALLPGLLFVEVTCQQSDKVAGWQEDSLRRELLARLRSGDYEQRLDAITQIASLWRDNPGPVDSDLTRALIESLRQDSSPLIRALAARALETAGGQSGVEIVPPLIAALEKEREVAVRKAIIYALARYPQPKVIAALTPLINNKNAELRAAAAYALAESGDTLAAAPLAEALRRHGGDEDAFARAQAARGLGRIGGRDSINPLLEALARDKSHEVRREAARALGQIASRKDAKVIEALRKAALSDDPYLALAADNAISSINSRNP